MKVRAAIVLKKILILTAILMIGACNQEQMVDSVKFGEEWNSKGIPEESNAAFAQVDLLISDVVKAQLIKCSEPPLDKQCIDFNTGFVSDLRREISNNWFRPSDSKLRREFESRGHTNPEEMAYDFVDMYIERLLGEGHE